MSPRHNQADNRGSSYELFVSLNSKVNLVDLMIQNGIDLKKQNGLYKALCPFHQEKTPSFTVNPRTNHYHCFGCGAHGHASQFLENHLKMSKVDVVQYLAELTHTQLENIVELRYEIAQADKTKEILKLSAEFYANTFRTDGGAVLEYVIENRGFTFQTCLDQSIGASSPQYSLVSHFHRSHQEFTTDDLVAAGVAKRHENRVADYFAGERVIFPVFDSTRRVVMLTGRDITGQSKAKYLHTSHPKSQILYGVHALPRRYRKLVVAEGHFDVLRGIEYGLPIVGTMGGMGSEWQVRRLLELSGYGDKPIYLCADNDQAGTDAAVKSVKLFFSNIADDGGLIRVAQLPVSDAGKKHDPDSFLLSHGIEEFSGVLDASQPGSEFFKSQFAQKHDFEDFARQSPEMQATLRVKLRDELKDVVPDCQFKTDLTTLVLSDKPSSQGIALNQPVEFLIPALDEENSFPIDALGNLGMQVAIALMKIVQCSPNMAAHQVLAAMMTATCPLGKIESFNATGSNDFISLNWAFLTIAPPGEGKGRCEKTLLSNLFDLSGQYGKQYQRDVEIFKQQLADWERVNKGKKQSYATPVAEEGNPLPPLEKLIEPQLRPQCRAFVKQSPNVPAIQTAYYNGTPFIAILAEEAVQFFGGWAMQDGRSGATLGSIIEIIDRGTISHNTASSDRAYEKRAIAISFGIQPGIWDRFAKDGSTEEMGFLSRFAILRPHSTQGYRQLAQPDDNDTYIFQKFGHRTVDLIEFALNHACAPKDDYESIPRVNMGELVNQAEIRCTPQAMQLWRDFWQELEYEKAKTHPIENRPGMFYYLKNFVNKYDQLVGKVAGWLVLFECDLDKLATQEVIPVVNSDIMQRAIRIVRFYMSEVYRVANKPKVDENTEQADKLLNWMYNPLVKRGTSFIDFQDSPVLNVDGWRIFTVRDLMRSSPIRESKQRILELLELIAKHDGIGRLVQGGSKNSWVFELAPKQKELYV